MLHSSLKLLKVIQIQRNQHDDLNDMYSLHENGLMVLLFKVLLAARKSDDGNEARKNCNLQLAYQVENIPSTLLDTDLLFPLLMVESRSVQQSAYVLLHKKLPSTQEQISIDYALSKQDEPPVSINPLLLSLVTDVPSEHNLDMVEDLHVMDAALRTYLLSWLLIFDHLQYASFAVRSAYVEELKETQDAQMLLNLIISSLGLSQSREKIDLNSLDVAEYTPSQQSEDWTDYRHLVVHMYYLLLRHLSSQVRSWFLSCTNRALTIALEDFTEKNISPILIARELDELQSSTNSTELKSENMMLKIMRTAREVTAFYTVDEQTMEIRVHLPAAYPLRQVEVEGVRRIGVKEDRWRAWILASQSLMTSQNGSIADALILFKKNATLHFEGVVECSICYSILSAQNRSLPTKKCKTCSNKFHAACLYKWFKSSNSSTCPLCRQTFMF